MDLCGDLSCRWYNEMVMSSVFTPPEFLSMSAVGLDVSTDAVRFLELANGKDGLTVARFGTRDFASGIVAEGHVRDKKKLHDTLLGLAREYGFSFANVSLPEEQAYLANLRIPRVPEKEMRDAIELRLEEHVPIAVSDTIFDYVVVGEHATGHKDTIDVVASVLPRSVVLEYLEVFNGTGIIPKSFELESQAIARAIIPRNDSGTFLVADIGRIVTDVFVVANGVVEFSASLDIGGHHITEAIANALHVSYEDAEQKKIEHGLAGGTRETALEDAMMPVILDLRARLLSHYTYWQTHRGEKVGGNIECVYLTGGGANLSGFTDHLSAGLEVRVVTANPWANVAPFERYVPPLSLRQAHGYSAAIGLALRDTFAD